MRTSTITGRRGAGRGRDAFQIELAELGAGLAIVRQLLELGDLGELAVVEHVIDDAEPVAHRGQDLHAAHRERAVPDDDVDRHVRIGELGADRGRHRIAHAVEIGRQDHAFDAVDRKQLGGQKGVIAVVEHGDGRVGRLPAQLVEEPRRIDLAVGAVRVPGFPIRGLLAPDQLDQRLVRLARRCGGIERDEQRLERLSRIARDGDLGRIIGVEDLRIDVDVDQVLGDLGAVAAGRDLGKPRSHRQQAIAMFERGLRGRDRGGPEPEPGVQRMIGREGAEALQRGRDRRLQPLGDGADLRIGIARAPADEESRVRGRREQRGGIGDLRFMPEAGFGRTRIRRQLGNLSRECLQVERDLHEHRTRLPARCDLVGAKDGRHDVLVPGDVKRRLGQALHELMQIHLVDLIAPSAVGAHPAGEDQHRDAVEEGFADAARRMGEAGGRYDDEGADARGQPAHGVGHERGTTFVRHQDRRDAIGAVELVIELGVLHARNAEGEPHPDLLERVDGKRGAGAFHGASEAPAPFMDCRDWLTTPARCRVRPCAR